MEISEVIKNIRLELNLSQEGLARELHMGFTSVNRWENHKSKDVYKRQPDDDTDYHNLIYVSSTMTSNPDAAQMCACLLYTSRYTASVRQRPHP